MNTTERKINYDSEWIHQLESQDHWLLYWKQQWLINRYVKKDDTILEIGIGAGFTYNYLKNKGHHISSIDIDENKSPDIVANIINYELETDFDIILAFEVFEHFPLKYLNAVLQMLSQHCRNYLLISIPEFNSSIFSIDLKLFSYRKCIQFGRPKILLKKQIALNHHWEVNYNEETKIDSLKKIFITNGFQIIKRYFYLDRHFIAMKRIS